MNGFVYLDFKSGQDAIDSRSVCVLAGLLIAPSCCGVRAS